MSVHKTKKGIWFSKWYEKTPEGFKEKRRYFAKDHEQEARDWDAQRKLDEAARQNHELTLVELAQEYFEARADELHPLTRKAMVNYITGAAASFAQKPCEAITRRDLQTLRKNLANVKPATRNKAQTYITAILNWGVTQELIYRNPWVGAPKLREEKYLVTATIDDFRKILEHAAPHLVWAVDVSLSLALRPGYKELLSLKWDRFRWQYGYVEVNQGKGGGLKTVYPPEAFLVRAHARFIKDQAKSIPWVVHFRGKEIKSLRTAWKTAKEKAGYRNHPIRLYDIRHVAATEMLGRGADPAAVQHQLGHRQLSTTINNYTHVLSGAQRKAGALIPDLSSVSDDDVN